MKARLTPEPVDSRSWAAISVEHYEREVRSVSDGLRQLADKIDEASEPTRDVTRSGSEPDFLRASERVLHELTWGIANLSIERVPRAAREVHEARAQK